MSRRCLAVAVLCAAFPGPAWTASAAEPLRYFVGKEILLVQVSKTTRTTRRIETLKGDSVGRCAIRHAGAGEPAVELCVTESAVTTREGVISTRLVPDPRLSADVSLAGKPLTDDQTTIEWRDGMLLHSLNAQSTGRAGDIVTAIARFAGLVIGAPGLLPTGRTTGPTAETRPVGTCNPFERPMTDQPDVLRLWLWENQEQCERWRETRRRQGARESLLDDRAALEHEIKGATAPELKLLVDKLAKVEGAIKKADSDLKARNEAFDAGLDAFAASLRLGVASTSRSYDQVLDLRDLPEPSGLSAGLDESTAGAAVRSFSDAARQLWDEARLIVTFDPVVPASCDPGPQVPGNGAAGDKNVVTIYFRQGQPARMRAFIADQASDPVTPRLRVIADRFDNFVHGCLPVSAMSFSRSAWASRELSVTFDDRGRPVKLVRNSKTDAAAMAAALASSANGFRDELAATVARVADVQANRRKVELDDLTTRIEKTQTEKELLDAQLAVGVAGVNYDTALKQKQASAALDLLKADLALATAQATAEQARQIDALKAAIALVNQQIDLIKAQQALERVKQ
jgi:hypothetical protein